MVKRKALILLFCLVMVFGGVITACSGGGKQNSEKGKTSITGEEMDNVMEDNWN